MTAAQQKSQEPYVALLMEQSLFDQIKDHLGGGERLRELGMVSLRYPPERYRLNWGLGPSRGEPLPQEEWPVQVAFAPGGAQQVREACAGTFDRVEKLDPEDWHLFEASGRREIVYSPFEWPNYAEGNCSCGRMWFSNVKEVVCPECREEVYLT